MAHTPGPWKVSHDEHEPYWNIDMPMQDGSGNYGYCNAMVYTTRDDARLIAAAPELLAACKLALDAGDQFYARSVIASAIAKAEGRTDDQG